MRPFETAELMACLHEEHDTLRQFVEILDREQHILVAGDIDALAELAQRKTLALESAVRCTSRRELHLKARGLPGDRDGMSALLQDQPIAREMWHRVLDCAKRSYDMNRANGCLIEARIGRNRQALAVMRPEAGMAATYRNDGQMQHAMSGRALGVG